MSSFKWALYYLWFINIEQQKQINYYEANDVGVLHKEPFKWLQALVNKSLMW